MRLTGSDAGALGVLLLLAVWFGRLLRERVPASWPRSLAGLLPLALVTAVVAGRLDAAVHLWRWVSPSRPVVPLLVIAVAAVTAVAMRRAGASPALAWWFAAALVLVGLTTLPSPAEPHLAEDPLARLWSCATGAHRWIPTTMAQVNTAQLRSDRLPNVALFVPLGAGLVFLGGRRVWARLAATALLSALLSAGIESYQALFTSRSCSSVDVATNAAGAMLGWLLGFAALQLARRLPPPERRPAAEARDG